MDLERFELSTLCLQNRRSTNWSYRPWSTGPAQGEADAR